MTGQGLAAVFSKQPQDQAAGRRSRRDASPGRRGGASQRQPQDQAAGRRSRRDAKPRRRGEALKAAAGSGRRSQGKTRTAVAGERLFRGSRRIRPQVAGRRAPWVVGEGFGAGGGGAGFVPSPATCGLILRLPLRDVSPATGLRIAPPPATCGLILRLPRNNLSSRSAVRVVPEFSRGSAHPGRRLLRSSGTSPQRAATGFLTTLARAPRATENVGVTRA